MKNGDYILIVAPPEYPGRKYRGRYIYEHHYIWWKNTGQLVPVGYDIHHENEIKTDNRFENLSLKTHSQHISDHAKPAPYITLECEWCNQPFELLKRIYNYKSKKGQSTFCCSRSCQVSKQQHDRKHK